MTVPVLITRLAGKPDSICATCARMSTGLVVKMRMPPKFSAFNLPTISRTILTFEASSSNRETFGSSVATPAVMTTIELCAASL
jgi:hypothetical protein